MASGSTGQLLDVRSAGIHQKNVGGAVSVGGEGDFLPVRRPGGIFVRRRVVGKVLDDCAIQVHQDDVEVAGLLGSEEKQRLFRRGLRHGRQKLRLERSAVLGGQVELQGQG